MERVKLTAQLKFRRVLPEGGPGIRVLAVVPTKAGRCDVYRHNRIFQYSNYLDVMSRMRDVGQLELAHWELFDRNAYLTNYGG